MAESDNGPTSLDGITDCEEDEGVQNCDHEPRLEFDDSELEQNKPEGNYINDSSVQIIPYFHSICYR